MFLSEKPTKCKHMQLYKSVYTATTKKSVSKSVQQITYIAIYSELCIFASGFKILITIFLALGRRSAATRVGH